MPEEATDSVHSESLNELRDLWKAAKAKVVNYSGAVRAQSSSLKLSIYGVCSLILLIKFANESSWTLVFAPFFVLGVCIAASASVDFYYSPKFQNFLLTTVIPLWTRIVPPHVAAKFSSILSFGFVRIKVLFRAAYKRVINSEEFKRNEYLKPLVHSFNLRSVFICLILLLLYTGTNGFFWTQQISTTTSSELKPRTTRTIKPGYPSIQRPLIFLHIPGSGGVSFRRSIHSDAVALQVNKFLPCFDGLKCAINTDQEFNKTFINEQSFASQLTIMQREMRCAAVIGGHFKMSLLGVLAALDTVDSDSACPSRNWHMSPSSAPRFNAIIVLRNPLNRIISHYYRFGRTGENKDKSFSELSSPALLSFLQNSGENLVISYLTSSKITDFPNIADATRNAMHNMQLCTVGIFEHWEETSEVLRHKNPWLHPPAQLEKPAESSREVPSSLDPSVLGVLINRLVAEMRIYEFALKRFKKEMKATPKLSKVTLSMDPMFDSKNENYYRHFVASPFPFS